MLTTIAKLFNITGNIEIAIDNANILQNGTEQTTIYNVTSATRTNVVLIAEIESLQTQQQINYKYR